MNAPIEIGIGFPSNLARAEVQGLSKAWSTGETADTGAETIESKYEVTRPINDWSISCCLEETKPLTECWGSIPVAELCMISKKMKLLDAGKVPNFANLESPVPVLAD